MEYAEEKGGAKQVDIIKVPTENGFCEIQLVFGSVTRLSKEENVDVLVISAFPDDYTPSPRSVIGALDNDLGISVQSLSEEKEEDLRYQFSCWWSKPLSHNCGFKRILCFEGGYKKRTSPPMIVNDIFRSLMSLCEKEECINVAMPLLSSGDQQYDREMMLRLMVETAIYWVKIGLPLKVLKIVIFTKNFNWINSNPLLIYFQELKLKWMEQWRKNKENTALGFVYSIDHDVYLSYSLEDELLGEQVKDMLIRKYNEIKIYSQRQNNRLSHAEMYEVMAKSKNFIAILSHEYLTDNRCIEEYSTALSCARNLREGFLTEFCFQSVKEMPMRIPLNPCNYNETLKQMKITQACCSVVSDISNDLYYGYSKQDDEESGYRSMDADPLVELGDGACENDDETTHLPIEEENKMPKIPVEHIYDPEQCSNKRQRHTTL